MSVLLTIIYRSYICKIFFLSSLLLLFVLLASTIVDQQYTNLSYLDIYTAFFRIYYIVYIF